MEARFDFSVVWLWIQSLLLLSRCRPIVTLSCCLPDVGLCTIHETCCSSEQVVDSKTISFHFIVEIVTQDDWDLQANISWTKPPGIYFDSYAVKLDYSDSISRSSSCSGVFPNYDITETEWIYKKNLCFGYRPFIIIRTANKTEEIVNQRPNDNLLTYFPDCYQSTGSVSFCQMKDVPVPGMPIGLRVDSITTDVQTDTPIATVNISWYPPTQLQVDTHNYTFSGFEVSLTLVDGDTQQAIVPVIPSQRTYTDPFSITFQYSFEKVTINWKDEVEIQVKAKLDKDNQTCSIFMCQGRTATIRVNNNITTVMPASTTALSTTEMVALSTTEMVAPPTDFILWVTLGVAGVLILTLMFVILLVCHRSRTSTSTSTGTPDSCFADKEFDRSLISNISEIGRGSFGVVYKGFAFGSVKGVAGFYPVAVKSLKDKPTQEMKQDFLEEIKLMIAIGSHPNIVTLLGCCTIDEPYLLLTEFMKYGDLLHFMWKSRKSMAAEEDRIYRLTEVPQLQIARQIARSMEYLSQTRYYHGDLAARNVLIGDNLLVKVSDFGLADDIYERGYKRMAPDQKRPVKWVSLETNITGKCSIESDVWSFGIVLYEIFTRGESPYQGLNNMEVIDKLKHGYRMDRPRDCPTEVYDIMCQCWLEQPSERPTFTKLTLSLDKLLSKHADYVRLDESAASIGGATSNVTNSSSNTQPGGGGSSELSGEPDELKLWLHVNGDLPESSKMVEFVPIGLGEDSTQSNSSMYQSIDMKKLVFQRDRDSDMLSV